MIHIVIKCRPCFTKSPRLVQIDPKLSKIQPFENVKIYKEMYGHPVRTLSDTGPVHTKMIVNANASKRKILYAFRPSVHTKTMKTLTINA